MIIRIARKELTEILRDGRFRVLAAVVLVVSSVSLLAGWHHAANVDAQHRAAQAASRDQWLQQPEKNPHSAAHYGVYAFKPKSQLAMVDTGIDPYVGVAVWLEAHKQNELKYRPVQDRTAVQRFGEMTAAETLQILLPLFIVLMTFSAFAGEREQGTLRQLLSLGIRGRDLALGKALGVATALALIVLPATVIGVIALVLSGDGLLEGDLARPAWLVVSYLAYFAAIVALALAVSARVRSSRLALVVLLAFWFANGLVASRAVADLAAALYPTPSAVQFQTAVERDLNDTKELQARLDRRKTELLEQYGVSTVDALPVAFSGISLQEGEEHGNEVFDRHYGRLFAQYENQNTVYQLGALVAPMLAVRSLSMGLAGTDFQQHRHFITAAEEYRRRMQRILNGDIAANQKAGEVYLAGHELWSQVPAFEYEAPPVSWVLAHQRWSLAILGSWLLGSIAVLFRAARTAPVD